MIERNSRAYVSEKALEDMGFNVYAHEDSVTYIDNFPVLDYAWAQDSRVIAHGLGGLDGRVYTNSREAFEYSYAQGHRMFEVDLQITADEKLVACHDWNRFYEMTSRPVGWRKTAEPLTEAEFKASRLHGGLTPLTLDDLTQLMADYPDVYVTLDTMPDLNDRMTQTYRDIVRSAQRFGTHVLDRIIPDIHSFAMYDEVFALYDWKSAVYSPYSVEDAAECEAIFDFAYRRGIKALSLRECEGCEALYRQIHDTDGYLYLYTYNDLDAIREAVGEGMAYGVYSDFLAPDALDALPRTLAMPRDVK